MTTVRLTCTGLAMLCVFPAHGETLADAIAFAYRTNPTLGASRYDLRAADERLVQAKAELRPTGDLETSAAYDRTKEGRAARLANPLLPIIDSRDSARVTLTIDQPIYTGGRATADRRVADAMIRANREALRIAEGDLLLGVINAYVDVRRYEAAREVWRASVRELQALTNEIQARREAGELTLTDVAQGRRQTALAQEQYLRTEQALEQARDDYAALVGHDARRLDPEPPLPQLPHDVDTAYVLAERMSPELARARFTEVESRNNVDAARSQGMPTLSLRGTGTLSGEADPYRLRDQDKALSARMVLTVPLSAGGRIASQTREAEARNGADRFRIEEARRNVVRTISQSWNEMVNAQRATLLLDEQRRAAIVQLDGTINEYRLGLRSTFDVLYAQQSLRDAEVALLGARRDRYVSEASLLRRAGLLEVRAIMTQVELHDPTANSRRVGNDNAVPWEGFLAALDRIGTTRRRSKVLEQPPIPRAQAAIVPGSLLPITSATFSRSHPNTPLLGTSGRSRRLDVRGKH